MQTGQNWVKRLGALLNIAVFTSSDQLPESEDKKRARNGKSKEGLSDRFYFLMNYIYGLPQMHLISAS